MLSSNEKSNVLNNSIKKAEKRRVAAHGIIVARARNAAEEELIQAQKALRLAEKRIKLQKKALKKFSKTGDITHLNIFGV